MATYRFTRGVSRGAVLGKLDAQVVGDHLAALTETAGHLTPRVVVDDAKAADSPTHKAFEWDDEKAADFHRLQQARGLISAVHVVVESANEQSVTTRAFIHVHDDDDDDDEQNSGRYEPLATVLNDAALYAQVCRRACAELDTFQDRYAQFQSLKSIAATARAAAQAELARASSNAEAVA